MCRELECLESCLDLARGPGEDDDIIRTLEEVSESDDAFTLEWLAEVCSLTREMVYLGRLEVLERGESKRRKISQIGDQPDSHLMEERVEILESL